MQIDIRSCGKMPRELNKRRDAIMSVLKAHTLTESVIGLTVVYTSCTGETKTIKCNYYTTTGWFFA